MNKELSFLIYNTPEDDVSVNVVVKDETIWVTQKAMAELFGVGIPAVSKHLKNIFAEDELQKEVVISILETTTLHGAIEGKTQTRSTKFYNLDAIISKNCWNVFVLFEQVREEYGCKLLIFLQSVVLIMIINRKLPKSSMLWCKTSFILL